MTPTATLYMFPSPEEFVRNYVEFIRTAGTSSISEVYDRAGRHHILGDLPRFPEGPLGQKLVPRVVLRFLLFSVSLY